MADNAGAMPGVAVDAAVAHGGDAVDELCLADGSQFDRATGAIHGPGLHVNRCLDVVAAVRVGHQLVEEVAPTWPIPEVVMWIHNRQLGFEDRLFASVEPVLSHRQVSGRVSWGRGLCNHWRFSPGSWIRAEHSIPRGPCTMLNCGH